MCNWSNTQISQSHSVKVSINRSGSSRPGEKELKFIVYEWLPASMNEEDSGDL